MMCGNCAFILFYRVHMHSVCLFSIVHAFHGMSMMAGDRPHQYDAFWLRHARRVVDMCPVLRWYYRRAKSMTCWLPGLRRARHTDLPLLVSKRRLWKAFRHFISVTIWRQRLVDNGGS